MIASSVHSVCSPRFQAGHLSTTPAVELLVHSGALVLTDYLCRHLTGDWGEIDPSDRTANERALLNGGPLLSSYHIAPDVNLRFVTERDRLVTTAFLPGESARSR